MRLKLLLVVFSISTHLSSQVRIDDQNIASTVPVNSSAILELISTNRGLIIPRVSLTSTLLSTPLANHVEGTMVYNTATSGMRPNNVTPGLYYNDGAKWVKSNSALNNTYWSLAGNSSTSPSSSPIGSLVNGDFLGTSDNKDLIFGSNNSERVRITSLGNVGINSQSPFSLFNPIHGSLNTRLSSLVSNGLLSTIMLNGTTKNLHLSNVLNANIMGDVTPKGDSNSQHSAIAQLNVVDADESQLNIGSYNDVRGSGSIVGSYSFAKSMSKCSNNFNLFGNFMGNWETIASYNETESRAAKSIGVVGRAKVLPPFCTEFANVGGLFEGLVMSDKDNISGSPNYGVVGRAEGSLTNIAVYGRVSECNKSANSNHSGLFENGYFHLRNSPIGINFRINRPGAWLTFGSAINNCDTNIFPLVHFHQAFTYNGVNENTGIHYFDDGTKELQHFMSNDEHISFNNGGKVQTPGINEIMRIVASSKNVGIGTTVPNSRLEINSVGLNPTPLNSYSTTNPSLSGLRFTGLNMNTPPVTNQSSGVLSLDANGDVIWVNTNSGSGSISSTCTTVNFMPKVAANGSPNLACSQIFDNGTNVGVGTTTPTDKLSVTGKIRSDNGPGTGFARLSGGATNQSGFFEIYKPNGLRNGYIGNDLNNLTYVAVNGAHHVFYGGNVGIGITPQKKLEIKDGTIGNSGLRFTNLTSSFNPTSSSTKFLTVNPSGDVILANSGVGVAQSYILSSNVSRNSTARSNVSGWSIPVVAGKSYKIEIIGTYQSAATTTGGSIGLVTVGAVGTIHGSFEMEISQTTSTTVLRTTLRAIGTSGTLAGSFITSTGVSAANSPHSIELTSVFNCTTSGTINVQWGSEVNASASQLNTGSVLMVTALN
ncbi:MAG: hypothetical protein ACK5QP_05825 [Chitinophagales bacterium]